MKKDQGFIKLIIIIVIAIIILGFLGIDIKQVVESPTTQHNFSYVTQVLLYIWDHFLKVPAMFIWDTVILPLIHRLAEMKK
jgi:hypothetical protein